MKTASEWKQIFESSSMGIEQLIGAVQHDAQQGLPQIVERLTKREQLVLEIAKRTQLPDGDYSFCGKDEEIISPTKDIAERVVNFADAVMAAMEVKNA